MKHKIQKVELFVGVIVLLGGLLTYGLGVHQLLPVPRPDLVVYGTTLIGIILILMGCDIFSKPTKEIQILENDGLRSVGHMQLLPDRRAGAGRAIS